MANTFDAATLADIIMSDEMLVLQDKHLPYDKFSTDFSDELVAMSPNGTGARSAIKVDLVQSGSTTQKNPTNYQQGDSTVTAITVNMNEYSQPFHITAAERNTGRKLRRLLRVNMHTLINAMDADATALMTSANYGAAVLTKDPSTVTTADIKTMISATGKFNERNLVTDATFWAQFAVTEDRDSLGTRDGAYGLTSFSYITDWTNAGTNVNGFLADPQAMAIATRLPDNDEEVREAIDIAPIELANGMTAQIARWVDKSSRTTWNSLDIVAGFGVGDASAGKLIQSA